MSNVTPRENQPVRFEEVVPTNTIVAFLDAQLKLIAVRLQLSLYTGYDDLDEIQFAFLTLPSGRTVVLGEYKNSPQAGIDLYADPKIQDVPRVVLESIQQLEILRSEVIWIHPDFKEEIDDQLCILFHEDNRKIAKQQESTDIEKLSDGNPYEPIDCFHHALSIYNRKEFPEYWAMLQHNLGLTYYNRNQGDRQKNLEHSIKCFNSSLEIYTQDDFPTQWKMNQDDLKKSLNALKLDQNTKPSKSVKKSLANEDGVTKLQSIK